jgi:queuosine precursor transporter
MSTAPEQAPAPKYPASLFWFAIFYGGMVCIAGVLGNKQVALGPLAVEAGIFAFLFLVITSSATAELFGRATANKLVLVGFVPLIFSILLSLLVWYLPPSTEMIEQRPEGLAAIQSILFSTWRIWIGGIVAYGISQILNVTLFTWLKGREGSRLLWFRSAVAGVLSQIVDTFVFVFIAFYGLFDITTLLMGQMLAKVVLSVVVVPPLIYLFVALGRRLDART